MTARLRDTDPARAQAYARLQLLVSRAATDDEARALVAELRATARKARAARWEPYPWQHPHTHPDGWVSLRAPGKEVCDHRCVDLPTTVPGVHQAWLQRGGRGTGKTEGAAHYTNSHVEGPACDPRVPGGHRLTIVAPTQPDAVSSCVTGVSGLQSLNPGVTVTTTKEGTIVRWPNGAMARVLGANDAKDVNRARAWTNVCLWWLEEAAAQPHLGGMLEQAPYTLRLGQRPHMVITTTPVSRPEVVALIDGTTDPDLQHIPRAPVQTWGRTEDAHRLPPAVRASYENLFRGTTRGRQELDGELLGDVAGALWVQHRPDTVQGEANTDDRPGIDNTRAAMGTVSWSPHGTLTRTGPASAVPPNPEPPEAALIVCDTVVVGVDPAGGSTENGISVVGRAAGHAYTLADLSLKAGPEQWGKVAVLAAYEYGAVGIALETTYGGDQATHVIATAAESLGLPMPALLPAPTREGKTGRATPVQALSQVHRVHHVGRFPKLESEQTTWVEDDEESPNRLDAWVHAVRHLLVRARPATVQRPRGRIH